jgi:hypothetical protein
MRRSLLKGLVLFALPLAAPLTAQTPARLGTVHFETSCAPSSRASFTRGVALLHSFGFSGATEAFTQVLASDPTCAIAYWGLALAAWGNPFAAGIKPNAQL